MRPQTPEDAENAINVGIGQRRGGLVQNQHPRVASQQARDLDQLALTDGQRANRAIEIPVGKAERRQGLLCAQAELGPPVQKRNLGAAKPNIVEDRQMRREAELLRH